MSSLRNLPKHQHYAATYSRIGYFWGLGIEHETYLATTQGRTITSFKGQMRPERYSVNYYDAYKADPLQTMLERVIDLSGSLTIPILMNSHSFTMCDVSGEHATAYSRSPTPNSNPRFSGRTLFQYLCQHSRWLAEQVGISYTWDGDTVEFTTQKFYRATVAAVLEELQEIEARFIQELQLAPPVGLLQSHGPLRLVAPVNEPWATYLTNPSNISMFNNGTIHINVTLPTQLGFDRLPLWPADFLEKHRRLARLVQWLEPLWIAVHGSPDPFAALSDRYAAGSQRLAVSRYIGLGTFDTEVMPNGKILQVPRSSVTAPWYDRLYAATDYTERTEIGLDINYNKHWAHGLELRFLDQLPLPTLRNLLDQIVVLMDIAMGPMTISDPRPSPVWQEMAYEALHHGPSWILPPIQLGALASAFGILEDQKEPQTPSSTLDWIFNRLEDRKGYCWSRMVEPANGSCCCLPFF